jgi:hypothetical protein
VEDFDLLTLAEVAKSELRESNVIDAKTRITHRSGSVMASVQAPMAVGKSTVDFRPMHSLRFPCLAYCPHRWGRAPMLCSGVSSRDCERCSSGQL